MNHAGLQEAVQKEAADKGMVILKDSNNDAEQRTRELRTIRKLYHQFRYVQTASA
jgi:hypothetical protein